VIGWFDNHGVHFLCPDVSGDYYRNQRLFLSSEDILANSIRAVESNGQELGFQVPGPTSAFIYYLIKKIDKEQLTHRHGDYLSSQWHRDPIGARAQAARWWDGADLDLVVGAATHNRWSPVIQKLPDLRREMHNRARITLHSLLGESARVVNRISRPTGLWVAFLGPDGCGKSTVISRVRDELAPAFRRTRRYHLRPHLEIHDAHDKAVVTDPHAEPPRSKATSTLKLGYWWIDYSLGYLVSVFPALVRSTFVLFDRYYYDLEVDPCRYRYGGSIRLARQLARLIPRPNLIVVLDLPVDVVHERKQEVPRPEIERQRVLYQDIARRYENGHVIDASQPLEDVVRDVTQLILGALERRFTTTP
jgi:thymidylate kinase